MISHEHKSPDVASMIELGKKLQVAVRSSAISDQDLSTVAEKLGISSNTGGPLVSRTRAVDGALTDCLIQVYTLTNYLAGGHKTVPAEEMQKKFEGLRDLIVSEIAPILLGKGVVKLSRTSAHIRLLDPKNQIVPGREFAVLELARILAGGEKHSSIYSERVTIRRLISKGVLECTPTGEVTRTWTKVVWRTEEKVIPADPKPDCPTSANPIVWLNNSRRHERLINPETGIAPGNKYTLIELAALLNGDRPDPNKVTETSTIPNLIQIGVFKRLPSGEIQRTEKQARLRRDKQHAPIAEVTAVGVAHSPALHSFSPEAIYAALQEDPGLRRSPSTPGKPFAESPDDYKRLVAAIGTGVPANVLSEWWAGFDVMSSTAYFHHYARLSIPAYRDKMFELCRNDLINQLEQKIEILSNETRTRTSDKPLSRTPHDVGSSTEALPTSASYEKTLEGQLAEYILQARRALITLLKDSLPGQILVNGKALQMLEMRLLNGLTLEKVSEHFDCTRERVRQLIERFADTHPLLEAIMNAESPRLKASPIKDLEGLLSEIRADPEAAFREGSPADPNPAPLHHETEEEYHRRIVFAAFSGAYTSETYTGGFPPPLKNLSPSAKGFFTQLVGRLANEEMIQKIRDFQVGITVDELREHLPHQKHEDAPFLLEYLISVVQTPNVKRSTLWKRAQDNHDVFPPRRYLDYHAVIHPLIRKQACLRAKEVCSVLEQPRYKPWWHRWQIDPEFLKLRVLEQLSISEIKVRLGASSPQEGVSFWALTWWSRLTAHLPTFERLRPSYLRTYNPSPTAEESAD